MVADKKREDEFNRKMNYEAFLSLRENNRVNFIDYDSLNKYYNQIIQGKNINNILQIKY